MNENENRQDSELQEFSLEDIMREFSDSAEPVPEIAGEESETQASRLWPHPPLLLPP